MVPSAQLKILIYEEFFTDIQSQYDSVTEFLGVECDGRTIFPLINAAREPKNGWLWRFVRRPPFPLDRLHGPAQSLARKFGLRPIKLLNDLDSKTARKAPANPAFDQELYDFFAADVAALEKLLGRSLAAWKAAPIAPVTHVGNEMPHLA